MTTQDTPAGTALPHADRPAAPTTNGEESGLAYKWKVLIVVSFGVFMIILDSTVVNVALRTLQRDFGASLTDVQWVISIYVLALGITTPMSGFLGERFGIKRVYLLGLSFFVIGSVVCGLSPTLLVLIIARMMQGVGGGMAQPLGPAMLYRAFPPREQGTALGLFGITLVVAPALGPLLGGLLVDAGLWRAIFFINIPIGIAAVAFGSRFLREPGHHRKPALDPLGLVLSIIGFGSILFGATIAERDGWTAPSTLLAFFVGTLSLAAFAYVELFVAKDPLLNLRLFKNKVFANATVIGYVTVLALFGAEFLMPLYLQALRGLTALETGFLLLALALASGITTPLAGRLYDRIGPRPLVTAGFVLLVINTWQLAQIGSTTPYSTIAALLFLRGLALGLSVQSTFTTALGSVPLSQLPRGSSLVNSTRFVVQAIAVALLATVLSSSISPEVRDQIERLQARAPEAVTSAPQRFGLCETPGAAVGQNLPPALAAQLQSLPAQQLQSAKSAALAGIQRACDEYVDGFERTYQLTFYFALIALVLALFLPGWPAKWGGRGSTQSPAPAGGH